LQVDEHDRITSSYTTLAGELLQAIAERTIVASSVTWPPPDPPAWPDIAAGARFALDWGLLRGAFAVRLADVVLKQERAARSGFLCGLVAAADLADLSRAGDWAREQRLAVGGREPLRSIYSHLLETLWIAHPIRLDDDVVELATARGA